MTRDVMIKVTGIQGGFGESDTLEMTTPGKYYEKNGKIYIKYIDRILDEENETDTTIKIEGDTVSIIRFGPVGTHLIFEKGRMHYSPYETPFGNFDMLLNTQDIQLTSSDELISLKIDYTLEINRTETTSSQMEVEVRPMQ